MLRLAGKLRIQASTVLIIVILLFGAWYLGVFDALRPGSVQDFSDQSTFSQGVVVNKKLEFSVIDKFAGAPVSGATIQVYQGTQLRETLTTDASGLARTALNYQSDSALYVLVVKGNSKAWYNIRVPRMTAADAQSASYNPIALEFFSLAAVSIQVRDGFGNSYANNANLNKTALGSDIVSITVSWFVNSDNTGFISSRDPINDLDWKAVMYVKLSGTNYETIQVTGLEYAYSIGTTNWFASIIKDGEITKYKVGNQYINSGTGSRTFTVNLAGYTGDLADLEIFIVVYTDPQYHRSMGSYGPDAIVLASHLINLVD